MTNTLVIWETVGEGISFYIIPNEIAIEYEKYLNEAHNNIINIDEMNDGLDFLFTAISTMHDEDSKFADLSSIFAKYFREDVNSPLIENISKVYFSGIYL